VSTSALTSEQESYLRTVFLERIAHELRGPIGVVQGSLEELELALGDDTEKHKPMFSLARRGIARLLRTATRLEQTGQIEGGTAQFNGAPCDLCALVRFAVAGADMLEARRKIAVALEVQEAPLICSVDARWMGVALSELASNAIRHAKQRAIVRLTIADDSVAILFSDDNDAGKDFAPARFLPQIERRGLGLGLAIARDVIVAHRGRLDIEMVNGTDPERGARVTVTLPRHSSAEEPAKEPVAS